VGLLAEPIKRDLHLSDTAIGLMTGLAFALFYAGLGIPLARLAEKLGRRNVIGGSTALFSVFTAVGSLVTSYWQLLISRVLVGVGEAGTTPASLAIITEMYPQNRRVGAVAVFTVGAQFGLLFGIVLAGIIGARFGWRAAFLVSGLPGICLALLVRLVLPKEPKRQTAPANLIRNAAALFKQTNFWLLVIAGGSILFDTSAIASFLPAYLQRAQGLNLKDVSLLFGGAIGVFGVIVTLVSGRLGNALQSRGRAGPLAMSAVCLVVLSAFFMAGLWTKAVAPSCLFLFCGLSLTAVWQGPILSEVQDLASGASRATTTAIYIFFTSLTGLAFGPVAVGILSDLFGHGSAAGLRLALTIVLTVNLLAAAIIAWLAKRHRQGSPA
jgi:predicted MFS family arabinose efflux permease